MENLRIKFGLGFLGKLDMVIIRNEKRTLLIEFVGRKTRNIHKFKKDRILETLSRCDASFCVRPFESGGYWEYGEYLDMGIVKMEDARKAFMGKKVSILDWRLFEGPHTERVDPVTAKTNRSKSLSQIRLLQRYHGRK